MLERHDKIAALASGNHQAIFQPYIRAQPSPLTKFYEAAFAYFLELLPGIKSTVPGAQCGVVQFPSTATLAKLLSAKNDAYLSASAVSEIAGVACHSDAVFLEEGGWISPSDLTDWFVAQSKPHLEIRQQAIVSNMQPDGTRWVLLLDDGSRLLTQNIVLACAYEAKRFAIATPLALEAIRGQVLYAPATAAIRGLRTVLAGDAYIIPAHQEQQMLGASFRHQDMNPLPHIADSQTILTRLSRWLAEPMPEIESLTARVCFRTSTPTRLPYIGRLAQHENVLASLGHGSRGVVSAPYAAKILVDGLFS